MSVNITSKILLILYNKISGCVYTLPILAIKASYFIYISMQVFLFKAGFPYIKKGSEYPLPILAKYSFHKNRSVGQATLL